MRPSPASRRPVRRPLAPVALGAPVLALLLAAAACGGDGATESAPPPLARLAIDQSVLDTISELGARFLNARGFDAAGVPVPIATPEWTSSDPAIATIARDGVVTGHQPGTTTVSARSGAVSTSFALRVLAVPIADIAIRLAGGVSADTLLVGRTASVLAEPRDAGGRPLLGRRVVLAADDPVVATIDSLGRATGLAVGPLVVIARVDSVERRRTLVVRPPFAAALAFRMADPKRLRDTLWIGLRDSAVVTFADSAGAPLAPTAFRPVSFTSDNPAVAAVDAEGRVHPAGAGTVTIRASGDRLVAARALVVVRAPITTVVGAPDTISIRPGELAQLRPILLDGAGLRVSALDGRALRFESAAPAIATVDAQGVVRGLAVGATTVRVTTEQGTTSVPVRVAAPVGERAFRIALRFVGPTPAPEVVAAFEAAKARWEGVVRETLGWTSVTLDAGRCGNTGAAFTEPGDVVITARIDSIDGPNNILGQAGPCMIRRLASGRYMPIVGTMAFDSADMRTMATTGRLANVVAHEMGHVLGIGTLWSSTYTGGAPLALQSGADPRYLGPGGMLAAAGMGFTGLTLGLTGGPLLERVPLENTGGAGTAGSHWRRSVFGNELMNGFAGSGASPLSLLTVQAMADMGYVVGTGGAESWGTFVVGAPFSLDGSAVPDPTAAPIREVLLAPEWLADGDGRVRSVAPAAARAAVRRE